MSETPIVRLRRLAEHAGLYGRCLTASDLSDLALALDLAEAAIAYVDATSADTLRAWDRLCAATREAADDPC
jgi:hypothetical protein